MAVSKSRSTAKREELLTVATDLFFEGGYQGVTGAHLAVEGVHLNC